MPDFEAIYKEYFQSVYKYVFSLCQNAAIAEEITQEAFYKAMLNIERFDGKCQLYVWLCQIAKNSYLTYLKKSGKVDNIDDIELLNIADPSETVEEKLVKSEEAMQIQKILHDIPEPYKEVFMWRVFAELSFIQIGQIFNKSENWACVTYHRACNKIKERMEANKHEK